MAGKRGDPNQMALPGLELDDQGKFDFAKPDGPAAKKARKADGKASLDEEHLPPNLAKPVKVKVPDFGNPKRPKTCLEVAFPIVPINALSALEGNAGKPIYQMSKWWARRRSCVFRAMLLAAAMEAPVRKNPDGSPVLNDQGEPIPDETEAAKAVWDVYYANHQAAGNFKHLKVLDCFMPPDFDPVNLPPEERKKYRYEGPEIIYTFWAKHGPCSKPGCGHRTPVFRSPVIAEKVLGVKYIELKCKECRTAFHTELGDARMAPGAEHVVLPNEPPFTALSQPFAKRLLEYGQGNKGDKQLRAAELSEMVDAEPGLRCPKCGAFAGQFVRDVLATHRRAARAADIDKKHLKIEPPRNRTKPVYCYLLIHPDWLKGSPGSIDGRAFGGYSDAPVDATALWYEERLKNFRFVEVRGRIKLTEDTSHLGVVDAAPVAGNEADDEQAVSDQESSEEPSSDATDRKEYGLPRCLTLADGRRLDTRKATVPEKSAFTYGACGKSDDFLTALKTAKIAAPVTTYALQGYCPDCDSQSHVYGGRFFKTIGSADKRRLVHAETEWSQRMVGDLAPYWPKDELPPVFMTHQNNGGIPNWGYTHFFKMFNGRQLLGLTQLLAAIVNFGRDGSLRDQALGGFQQYLRNQNMFCIWNVQADKLEPFFSNSNYAPKALTVENSFFGSLGRGNWTSCAEKVVAGTAWARDPWEIAGNHLGRGSRLELHDPISAGVSVFCRSASDLEAEWTELFDLLITDPPFGNNIFYGDLANYFHVWMRPVLEREYPEVFRHRFSPRAQECVADRSRFPGDVGADESHPDMKPADAFYEQCLRPCWDEARRVMKPGGLMAFTFHHSADAPWESVLRSLFDDLYDED